MILTPALLEAVTAGISGMALEEEEKEAILLCSGLVHIIFLLGLE